MLLFPFLNFRITFCYIHNKIYCFDVFKSNKCGKRPLKFLFVYFLISVNFCLNFSFLIKLQCFYVRSSLFQQLIKLMLIKIKLYHCYIEVLRSFFLHFIFPFIGFLLYVLFKISFKSLRFA